MTFQIEGSEMWEKNAFGKRRILCFEFFKMYNCLGICPDNKCIQWIQARGYFQNLSFFDGATI